MRGRDFELDAEWVGRMITIAKQSLADRPGLSYRGKCSLVATMIDRHYCRSRSTNGLLAIAIVKIIEGEQHS